MCFLVLLNCPLCHKPQYGHLITDVGTHVSISIPIQMHAYDMYRPVSCDFITHMGMTSMIGKLQFHTE